MATRWTLLGTIRNSSWQRAVSGPAKIQQCARQQHTATHRDSPGRGEKPYRTKFAPRPNRATFGKSGWKEAPLDHEHSRLRSGLFVADVQEVVEGLRELLEVRTKLETSAKERKDHAAIVQVLQSHHDQIGSEADWNTIRDFAVTRVLPKDPPAFFGLLLVYYKAGRSEDLRHLIRKALEDTDYLPAPKVQGDLVALYASIATLEETVALARGLPPVKVHFNNALEAKYGGTGAPLTVKRAWKILARESAPTNRPRSSVPDKEIRQWEKQTSAGYHVRHAILAWGLDSSKIAEDRNMLARRFAIMLSAAPASRDMQLLSMLIDTAFDAKERGWLTFAHDDNPNVDWNAWAFASLFPPLLASGQKGLADRVWSLYCDVRGPDQSTDIRVANSILDGHTTRKDWKAAAETWKTIDKPDDYTCTTMLVALCRSNDIDGAMRLFAQRRAEKAVRVEMCNAVLLGYYFQRKDQHANALFDDMVRTDSDLPMPNITTINTMLRAHGRRKDGTRLIATLRTLSDLKLNPDVFTWTTYLDALLRLGYGVEALPKVVQLMQRMGVETNAVTLTAMIKVLVTPATGDQENDSVNLEAAMAMLEGMETKGPRPNEITYTSLMAAFFREARTPPQVRESAATAISLLGRMRRLNLEPNRITYHTLLGGLLHSVRLCADHGDEQAAQKIFERALELFEEMGREVGEANRPVSRTWLLMLESLGHLSRSRSPSIAQRAVDAREALVKRVQREHLPLLPDKRAAKQRWDHEIDDNKLRRLIDSSM